MQYRSYEAMSNKDTTLHLVIDIVAHEVIIRISKVLRESGVSPNNHIFPSNVMIKKVSTERNFSTIL